MRLEKSTKEDIMRLEEIVRRLEQFVAICKRRNPDED
jgi:hypothetical protein